MKRILFIFILIIGNSSVSVADEYAVKLYKNCINGSIEDCDEGIRMFCSLRYTSREGDKGCGLFRTSKGKALWNQGNYIEGMKLIDQAIRLGYTEAQQVKGQMCSRQPWVCQRGSL